MSTPLVTWLVRALDWLAGESEEEDEDGEELWDYESL
jgi:hypothetical protein